ncbi:MAG: hypothetical protein K6F05_06465 [Succinivibrio sp.]|nr:hypothetical protein [Succinivibrio sp.]
MNRQNRRPGALLWLMAMLMPIQLGYAADDLDLELEQTPVSEVAPADKAKSAPAAPKEKNINQAELDRQRKALRQELLNDRATSVQRQAIAKSKAPETEEEKEARQKLYEESASERGDSVIADREALRDGRIHLDAEKLRGLGAWAKGDGEAKPMSAQQLARIRREQESRKSISGWASGGDIQEARRKAREETKQEILRQLRDTDSY